MIKKAFLHSLVFACLLIGQNLNAQRISAYQGGSYYPGLENIRDYANVPAGLFFIDYNYWVNSEGYYDKNGDLFKGGTIELDDPPTTISVGAPDAKLYLNVPVLFYASKAKVLGAQYQALVAPLYINSSYSVFLTLNDTTGVLNGSNSGFGDLCFMPLGLSWTMDDRIDVSYLLSIYAPTGRYATGADDNLGQGFWTFQSQVPFYYYLMEKATALVVIPTLELNTGLKNSDFKAGNRFTLEYGISQYFTDWLEVEVINGHNWQVSNDIGGDIWWRNTRFDGKDAKNTIAVGVGVWPVSGVLNVRLKYIQDYGVKQRFKNRFWSLSLVLVPGLLDE